MGSFKRLACRGPAVVFLWFAAWSNQTRAQVCCSATSAISPGRLALHERGLSGIQPGATGVLGTFDQRSSFLASAPDSHQVDFTMSPFATVRVARRVQWGAMVPILASSRASNDSAEFGGGVGDVSTTVRYDPMYNGEYRHWPGLGLVLGAVIPTGRPPEESTHALGSDVTGLGVFQFNGGIWLERSFGAWLVSAAGLMSLRTAREVDGIKSQLAPHFTVLLAVGYSFSEEIAVALSTSLFLEANVRVNGESVPDTARYKLHGTLALSYSPSDTFRLQASAGIDPPLDGWGRNELSTAGGALTLIRSFR